jgi:transposase
LAIAVASANTHDKNLVQATLEQMVVDRPKPTSRRPQHFCADKGYDYPDVRQLIRAKGYIDQILKRGDHNREPERIPSRRARRWVVERTHAWLNKFRRILVRWEKKAENYAAMLHLACAVITFRLAGVLG